MMDTSAGGKAPEPDLFEASPYLDDRVNRNIIQSEIDGGVLLNSLLVGVVLEITTLNRRYLLENRGAGRVLISGHDKYCPVPVLVKLTGSTWGGSMLKQHFVGRSMHMEFVHPSFGVIRTSPVKDIRELQAA